LDIIDNANADGTATFLLNLYNSKSNWWKKYFVTMFWKVFEKTYKDIWWKNGVFILKYLFDLILAATPKLKLIRLIIKKF